MPMERIPTMEKYDKYTDFDRKSYFKGNTKDNGSIKKNVFGKNIRAVFCGIEE
jgi:hypothetical protein